MIRIPFLRTAIALGALGAPLLACGGRVVSIGSNADQLTSVAPTSVSSSVGTCPTGYQHPNICCSGGPSESSSCGAYINKPFRPCDVGSVTYPNALSCCSLSDGTCIDSGSSTTPPTTGPSTGVCTSACPPGWWSAEGSGNSTSSGGGSQGSSGGGSGTNGSDPSTPVSGPAQGVGAGVTCCRSAGGGLMECMGGANASTGSNDVPPSTGCATVPVGNPEPAPTDAGVNDAAGPIPPPTDPDAGCIPSDAGTTATPPPPPPGTCTIPCPDGWTSQPGAPDVCCRDNGDGSGECFSQSSGGWGSSPGQSTPPNPGTNPGGPSSGRDCFGTAPAGPDGGSAATCGCTSEVGQVKEELSCDDATRICTCTSGSTTSALPYPTSAAVCFGPQALDSLWVACGFAL